MAGLAARVNPALTKSSLLLIPQDDGATMAVQTNSSAHPLISPLKEEDRLAWLRLLRSRRVGISTFYRLLKEHGTAQSALEHLPEVARTTGVDVIYPAENAQLTQQIRENGLLISEQPMGTQPQARHFPVRNRLISGLSQAIVVIEAAAKSGSFDHRQNRTGSGARCLRRAWPSV